MIIARGTPTSNPIADMCLSGPGGGGAELVGGIEEVSVTVGASELPGLEDEELDTRVVLDVTSGVPELVELDGEEEEDVSVAVDNPKVAPAVDCPDLSVAENGYGSSAVVRLVVQQSTPPRPCPGAPAQHQLLPLGSQRLTSVNPSN